jgi:hypothetical protein
MDATSGVALELKTGVPTYQVEDEEGRTHLLIHVPIEEEDEDRWCFSGLAVRSSHGRFASVLCRSIERGDSKSQQIVENDSDDPNRSNSSKSNTDPSRKRAV